MALLRRQLLRKYEDIAPLKGKDFTAWIKEHKYALPTNISVFHDFFTQFHYFQALGLKHLCETQSYGYTPGHNALSQKEDFALAFR